MNPFKHLLKRSGSQPPVGTWLLSASPLLANRRFAAGQLTDIAEKLEQVRARIRAGSSCRRHACPPALQWKSHRCSNNS